jgi:hypothetical protein
MTPNLFFMMWGVTDLYQDMMWYPIMLLHPKELALHWSTDTPRPHETLRNWHVIALQERS